MNLEEIWERTKLRFESLKSLNLIKDYEIKKIDVKERIVQVNVTPASIAEHININITTELCDTD